MGEITSTIIEFIKSDKRCTLHSSEIAMDAVFQVMKYERVKMNKPELKSFKAYDRSEKMHYIEYEG